MNGSHTSVVHCDDGTEMAVDWVYPRAEQGVWAWNDSHFPEPATPMGRWLRTHSGSGIDRAWDEPELIAPAMFYRFQFAGPFSYLRMDPDEPERASAISARLREAARQHGNAQGFWRDHCEPRARQVCQELAAAAPDVPLQWVADRWGYGQHQTFTSASMLREAMMRLTLLLAEYMGGDATLVAYEVTQGGENASQAIDGEIWELASLARKMPSVSRILTTSADGELLAMLRDVDDGAAFVEAFDALIARHGSRSQSWELTDPTWREQPEAPLSLVRAQFASDAISPTQAAEKSKAQRRAATDRVLAALPKDRHDEFASIVAELDGYVGVREGRAYWQLTMVGEVRDLLLRRGKELVDSGRLESPDDILFLEPDDIEDGTSSDLRQLVAARRREWEQWCRVTPPALIGVQGKTAAMTAAAAAAAAPSELRGSPASRGVIKASARILNSPGDASRLQPGEVMVCVMTTPAWTPLFGIAGGIVTETGGVLSHPAITAREYGIPAVLAVKDATRRIRDGQVVTVDGGAGIVSLHD